MICIRLENEEGWAAGSCIAVLDAIRAIMLADGIPVRAKDFSQSKEDGPRMLPSMNASPGQRVQLPRCAHVEQVGKSRARIERTSLIRFEWRQMSRNFSFLTLPQARGN